MVRKEFLNTVTILLVIVNCVTLLLFVESLSSFVVYIIIKVVLLFSYNRSFAFFSFSIGVLITLFFYHYQISTYGNHYYLGKMSDDFVYEQQSSEFFELYRLNVFKLEDHLGILHNSVGYVYLLAILNYFSQFLDGYHTLVPRIINLGFIQLCAFYIYNFCFESFSLGKRLSTFAAFSFSLFPSVIFISQNVFRDIIVSTLIIMILYHFNLNRKRLFNVVFALLLCLILFYFRKLALFLLVMIIPLYLFDIKKINSKLLIIGSILGLSIVLYFGVELESVTKMTSSYDELNTERLGNLATSIFTLPKYIGIFPRISFLALNPLPGFANLEQFYSGISVFIQIFLFPFAIAAIKDTGTELKLKLTYLLLFIGVAMSTINFRHITMFLPYFFILIFHGIGNFEFGSNTYIKYLILILSYLLITLSLAVV